jgi:predicted anti-sigma-YlaC factor YlaD
MTHLLEEEMIDAYYAGVRPDAKLHLESCEACAALYRSICDTFDNAAAKPVPPRDALYPTQVWARLEGSLPRHQRYRWAAIPAMAAGLAVAFLAGMWAQRMQSVPVLMPPNPKISLNIPPVVFPKPEPVVRHHHRTAAPPQMQAVRAMEQIGSPATRTLLATVTEGAQPSFRVSAIHTLAAEGDSGIIFSAIYRTDRDARVKRAALEALEAQHDNAALLDLARRETNDSRRAEILRHLAK